MNKIFGTSNKYLEIDLTIENFSIYKVSDEMRRAYLGGKGLALKLLFDRLQPNSDPLSEDNIFVLDTGVMLGTNAPCSGRFDAASKSPLTGIITTSSCGGPFGMALKTAGWDGLILQGKLNKPKYLYIDEKSVEFIDASNIWGLDTIESQKIITKDSEAALLIGPAGENLVKYANIVSGHRFLGRNGLGAVFGSKNLKAIVAKGGSYKIFPVDKKLFEKAKKRANSYIKSNNMTSNVLRNYGTAQNIEFTNNNNILPVNNFSDGQHKDAIQLSGKIISEEHNTKPHTCKPCSIICGHKGLFGDKTLAVPEFETVGLLGSNLGIFDNQKIAEINEMCTKMGIDTISLGGTIAWAMEATEKGIIDTDLAFGKSENIIKIIKDISLRKGFGNELAEGSKRLSEKYGGKDFAIHVKGLEVSAYDPRGAFGQGLSYAVANRGGCHLSAYPVALEVLFGLLNPYKIKAKAEFAYFMENLYSCINSLQSCQFTAFAYIFESPLTKHTPDFLLGFIMQYLPKIAVKLIDFSLYKNFWMSITGLYISRAEFIRAGERIHILERYMNCREGIRKKDDTLPERLLNQPRKSDTSYKKIPLSQMLDKYYNLRGYDNEGVPKQSLLKDLEII